MQTPEQEPLSQAQQLAQIATLDAPSMNTPASLLPSLVSRLSYHGPHGALPVAKITCTLTQSWSRACISFLSSSRCKAVAHLKPSFSARLDGILCG